MALLSFFARGAGIALRRTAVAAAMVMGSITAATAAEPSTALQLKADDAASLLATAESQGYVRVIVEFLQPNRPAALTPDPAALEPVKAEIAAIQDTLIAAHLSNAPAGVGDSFIRAYRRLEITPMMAVNVTPAELESLASDDQVIRISPDLENHAQLIDSVPLIGMPAAYADGGSGNGFAVAILDTGIRRNHEFFGGGKVIAGACFSTPQNASESSLCQFGGSTEFGLDSSSALVGGCFNDGLTNQCQHGTHVAGIAAGFNTSPSFGEPTNGVARSADIVAIQVFRRTAPFGSCATSCISSSTSDEVAALEWLFQNALTFGGGIRLASVNMSLGGSVGFTSACDTSPLKAPIDDLRSVGVPTVISAGNDSFVNAVSHPGCISTAVTVASSTKSDVISSFSNISNQVAVFAPGSSILSSIPTSTTAYTFMSGTSMAAPHVAGAIASIRSACSNVPNTGAGVNAMIDGLEDSPVLISDTRGGGTVTNKPRIRVDLAINYVCAVNFAPPPGPGPAVAFEPAALLGLSLLGYLGFRLRRRNA